MHDTYGRVDLPPISRSLSLLSSQPGHQAAGTVTSDCMLGGGEPQPIDERNAPIQRITADCRVRRACIYPYTLKREHYHTAQRCRVPSQQNRGEQECIACCLPELPDLWDLWELPELWDLRNLRDLRDLWDLWDLWDLTRTVNWPRHLRRPRRLPMSPSAVRRCSCCSANSTRVRWVGP